jgi:hypothetical protein
LLRILPETNLKEVAPCRGLYVILTKINKMWRRDQRKSRIGFRCGGKLWEGTYEIHGKQGLFSKLCCAVSSLLRWGVLPRGKDRFINGNFPFTRDIHLCP